MHRLHLLWFALSAPNEWSLIVKHIFSYFVLKAFFFYVKHRQHFPLWFYSTEHIDL